MKLPSSDQVAQAGGGSIAIVRLRFVLRRIKAMDRERDHAPGIAEERSDAWAPTGAPEQAADDVAQAAADEDLRHRRVMAAAERVMQKHRRVFAALAK